MGQILLFHHFTEVLAKCKTETYNRGIRIAYGSCPVRGSCPPIGAEKGGTIMTTTQALYVLEVADSRSISQAARRLYVSQSAISQQIMKLDSMQSVTAADIRDGASYLSIMEKNLSVLKQALGEETN